MFHNLIKVLALGSAFYSSVSLADYGAGGISDFQTHRDWVSMVFNSGSLHIPRIGSSSRRYSNTSFVIDFQDGRFIPKIMTEKTGNEAGHILYQRTIESYCELRIDTKPVLYTACEFSDDSAGIYVLFTGLDSTFINEMKSGSTLRMKLGTGSSAYYDNYSLTGFNAAYRTAESLGYTYGSLAGDDSSYFR